MWREEHGRQRLASGLVAPADRMRVAAAEGAWHDEGTDSPAGTWLDEGADSRSSGSRSSLHQPTIPELDFTNLPLDWNLTLES